ncbi:hypothetical protein ACKWTF_000677 [Chironomus riparius]
MSKTDAASKSFLNSDAVNDEFFIDIVERKLNIKRDQFKLRLVFIAPATGKNENYASVVYRAKISIELLETKEKKLVDVIVKALIVTMEEMKEFAIFEREIVVYKEVIGDFENTFLERANEVVEFGPKCIKIVSKPYEIIVLDDLKAEGYVMADRKVGLGLEESKLVFSKLAKFHAASVIRHQKDGMISPHLDRLVMMQSESMNSPEQVEKSTQAFLMMYRKLVETAQNIEGFEKIAEKMSQWDPMKLMTIFMAIAEPMQGGLKVLNHGDDWLNNMMFKYDDEGRVLDLKFIDFQMSFWGSPANDLIYFFISSIADDVKVAHFDDLIQFYHNELVDSLKKLNYDQPIPTLYELHVDLLQKGGAFGFHMMFVMFIAKYDSPQDLDITQIFEQTKDSPGMFEAAFKNPIYQAAFKSWLPFLDKRGYLDAFLPNAPMTPFVQGIIAQMPKPEMPEPPKTEE